MLPAACQQHRTHPGRRDFWLDLTQEAVPLLPLAAAALRRLWPAAFSLSCVSEFGLEVSLHLQRKKPNLHYNA